ncbi:hypothetical protein [Kineosporia succinea]|uniref:Glycosyl transferase family 4 n=1 Tax=Kineosporia succinea TaxID=84632 RepID=A0ABT9PB56_9ACTN|nr:hypothetical protein [Kineosporia succinea]MDP9829933.1 hypothetical protein [Kineosporia succinea]
MNKNLVAGLFTREYPPHVYGGGGVHAGHLARHLPGHGIEVQVHRIGAPTRPHAPDPEHPLTPTDTPTDAADTPGAARQVRALAAGQDKVASRTAKLYRDVLR